MSLAITLLTEEIDRDRRQVAKINAESIRLELEVRTLRDLAETLLARIAANERKVQEMGGAVAGLSGQHALSPSVPSSPNGTPTPPAVAPPLPTYPPEQLHYVIRGSAEARTAPPGTPVLVGPPPELPLGHLRHEYTVPPVHGAPNKPGDLLPTGAVQPPVDPLITTDMQYTDPETKEEQEGI